MPGHIEYHVQCPPELSDESYRLITALLGILSGRSVRAREVTREVSIAAERGA